MDAPERIWAWALETDRGHGEGDARDMGGMPYIRADLAAPDMAELVAALRECTEWMESLRASGDAGFWDWKNDEYTRAIAVLAKIKEPQHE